MSGPNFDIHWCESCKQSPDTLHYADCDKWLCADCNVKALRSQIAQLSAENGDLRYGITLEQDARAKVTDENERLTAELEKAKGEGMIPVSFTEVQIRIGLMALALAVGWYIGHKRVKRSLIRENKELRYDLALERHMRSVEREEYEGSK